MSLIGVNSTPVVRPRRVVDAQPPAAVNQVTGRRGVIQARKVSLWSGRYDILADGAQVGSWEKSGSATGGALQWEGRRYHVRASLSGGTASMSAPGGAQIARAHDVGRKRWTIDADGVTYAFHRAPPWRQEERLQVQGRAVGSVRRTSILRGDTAADLPGLPVPVALFALTLVLTVWDATAAW